MAKYKNQVVFENGALKIMDLAGSVLLYQPHCPNSGGVWPDEATAMAWARNDFGYLLEEMLPPDPVLIDSTSTNIESTSTIGTGA